MHVANLHGISLVLGKLRLSLCAWHMPRRVRVHETDYSAAESQAVTEAVVQEVLYVWPSRALALSSARKKESTEGPV